MSKEKNIWGMTPFGDEKYSISPEHARHLSESSTKNKTKSSPNKKKTLTSPSQQQQSLPTVEKIDDESPSKELESKQISKLIRYASYKLINQFRHIVHLNLRRLNSSYLIITNYDINNSERSFHTLICNSKQVTLKIVENNIVTQVVELELNQRNLNNLYFKSIINSITKNDTDEQIKIDAKLSKGHIESIIEFNKILPQLIDDLFQEKAFLLGFNGGRINI